MAVSDVMKRTLRFGPPKQKFTAPGREISPMSAPAGETTCTPLKDEA
jgi:hypothetical protein